MDKGINRDKIVDVDWYENELIDDEERWYTTITFSCPLCGYDDIPDYKERCPYCECKLLWNKAMKEAYSEE